MGNTKRKETTSMNIYLRILRYVFPYWNHLSLSMICAVLYSIFSGLSIYIVIPLLKTLFAGDSSSEFLTTGGGTGFIESAKVWLNHFLNYLVFADNQLDSLLRVCLILVAGFLLRNFFSYFQSYTMAHVEQGLMMDIRNDLFKHIHNLSIGYFSNERTGNLISRVTNDVTVVNSGVSASFVTFVKEPFSAAIYLVLAIAISWKLTVISFLAFPFALIIISWIGLKLHKESRVLQEKMADITSVLQETIFGEKIVKLLIWKNSKIKDSKMKQRNISIQF
jgi:ATP-binding cassette, subfamily B, bacterial MsbA